MNKSLPIVFLAIAPSLAAPASDDGQLAFDCVYTSPGNCMIRFEADDDSTYSLVQIRKNKSKSRTVFPGDSLKPGFVYYLLECESAENESCRASSVFFAPDIRDKVTDYPREMKLDNENYAQVHWEDTSLEDATEEYNFYKFVTWLNTGPSLAAMDMVVPPPHIDGDPNFPHMENVIHHQVYDYFQQHKKEYAKIHKSAGQ